jgi:hypothetical protein
MSSRTHRKAFPLDPGGIRWGTGERHESGTPWEPDEWQRFVVWACENGANINELDHCVQWRETPCEDPLGHGPKHRENGPTSVWPDGHEDWFLNGKRHREDGPAVVLTDGYKAWFLDGKRHREDGPARVWSDGYKEWWLNGSQFYDETFTEAISSINARA